MEQYIPKAAVVAEIEKLKYVIMPYPTMAEKVAYRDGIEDTIKTVIKSLEVKEVDLDKVFNDEYSKFSNDTDAMDYAFPIDLADYREFAKRFFELGIAVNNKAQKGE